jgi:hypothetical protein
MLIFGLILPCISTHAMEPKLAAPLTGEYNNFLPTGKITRFAGETLYYDISFLWFENAASAKVSFFEEHGKYFSVLESSTKGFFGFFTAYRKHYYKTAFEVIDKGRRLRPKTFLRQVMIASNAETTRHKFDYSHRLHTGEKYANEEKVDSRQDAIPTESAFHDILTSFYNIKNSNYKKLKKRKEVYHYNHPEKGTWRNFCPHLIGTLSGEIQTGRETEKRR